MTLTETNFTKSSSRPCVIWHVSDDGTWSIDYHLAGLAVSGEPPPEGITLGGATELINS